MKRLTSHDFCVMNEAANLIDKGFTCYLEECMFVDSSRHVIVDIYAKRSEDEIIVEVGSLCHLSDNDRLSALKKLKSQAKIIHVHQWKNYGITDTLCRYIYEAQRKREYWNSPEGLAKRQQAAQDVFGQF